MVLSQQLKGTQRSNVVSESGTILSIGDTGKGTFSAKNGIQKINRLDLWAEPHRIKFCWRPPGGRNSNGQSFKLADVNCRYSKTTFAALFARLSCFFYRILLQEYIIAALSANWASCSCFISNPLVYDRPSSKPWNLLQCNLEKRAEKLY